MYARTQQHLDDERRWADVLRTAPPSRRDELFRQAYDAIHERCLAERTPRLEDMMFGTGRRVLEVGCGCGRASIELARRGNRVTGIDVSSVVVERARRFAGDVANVDFRVTSGTRLDFEPGTFDVVFSVDVFEHIHPDDVDAHLAAVRRVLRPGGICVVITVNAWLGPHDVTREVRGIESFGEAPPEGFHLKEWTFGELYHALRRAGFGRVRSNALPWRRFPRNVYVPAGLKAAAEHVVARLPRRPRRLYKLAFRVSALASMVFVAERPADDRVANATARCDASATGRRADGCAGDAPTNTDASSGATAPRGVSCPGGATGAGAPKPVAPEAGTR